MVKLPNKELFRIDEVALYFDVHPSTIRQWIAHELLPAEKYHRVIRISRESIVNFRLKSKIQGDE